METNGDEYVGEWKDGKKNGEGTLIYTDGRVLALPFEDNHEQPYQNAKSRVPDY
jgi:hypothetical protein